MANQDGDKPKLQREHADAGSVDDSSMSQITSDIRERLQAFFFDGHVLGCVAGGPVERTLVHSEADNESSSSTIPARGPGAPDDTSCA